MIETLKRKLYNSLVENNIEMTDNWSFDSGTFPKCMLRLSNSRKLKYLNTRVQTISFTLDVFSTYNGEKEILDLEEQITDIFENIDDMPEIMGVQLTMGKILDEKSKGPVCKHGIFIYQFILATGWEEEE